MAPKQGSGAGAKPSYLLRSTKPKAAGTRTSHAQASKVTQGLD
jgi:hypothetical protein